MHYINIHSITTIILSDFIISPPILYREKSLVGTTIGIEAAKYLSFPTKILVNPMKLLLKIKLFNSNQNHCD